MLLSNSLFLDSEYKADVEYKINYLSVLKDGIINPTNKNLEDGEDDFNFTNEELFDALEKKIIFNSTNDRPYISDGQYLYGTKQISDNYYKILLENHANNEQNTN